MKGSICKVKFRSKDADSHQRDIRMNRRLVSKFRKKLENLPVADYHGLHSPGFTCYLNSVLQVLFMTENFRDAVKSQNHHSGSKDSPTIDPELRNLFRDLETKMAKTHNITGTLGITDVYEQRDAAEYFEKILRLTSPDASKIFKGELNQRITCCKCNMRNESSSFFWILPLTVEESSHKTYCVKRGLEAFFELQKVCDDDQIYCNRCDEKQDTNIKSEITQHPDVLTLLLKSFTFDYKLKCYVKLHCEADVPQTLHMEKCTYDLYAVVNHFGSLTGGHYTAEIKSFETGRWYYFDDNRVKSVKQQLFGAKENSLRSSTAYILLYRKVSKEPAKTDGSGRGAQHAHSEVEAEGRSDEVERGEAPVLHYQPEKYNDKGKDVTNSSGELDKQPNQRAAHINKSALPQLDTKADEQQLDPNTKEDMYHCTDRVKNSRVLPFQQNSNTQKNRQKAHETLCEDRDDDATKTGTKTSRAERSPGRNRVKPVETIAEENKKAVKVVGVERNSRPDRQRGSNFTSAADRKSNSFYCNGYSPSVPHSATYSNRHHKINEPCNCKDKANLCKKIGSFNGNMDKTQHVTVDSKHKTKQTMSKSDRAKNSRALPFQQNSNTQKNRQKAHETLCEDRDDDATKTGTKTSRAERSPGRNRVKPVETIAEENKKRAVKHVGMRGNSRPDRQRGNSFVSTADEKSYSIYCNGICSSVPHSTSYSSSHHKINEYCNCKDKANLCKRFGNCNGNIQHVTVNSKCKTEQTMSKKTCKCDREKKVNTVTKEPWR